MDRVRSIIGVIEHHDSVERYTGLGVDCFAGHATIESPYCVDVDGQKLTTRSIVIASGAEPAVPPLPGIDDVNYYTSDTIWEINELPKRLLVLGGGADWLRIVTGVRSAWIKRHSGAETFENHAQRRFRIFRNGS